MLPYASIELSVVMRGLDPRIHADPRQQKTLRAASLHLIMDCRVKPGNDSRRGYNSIPMRPASGGADAW
jgi:hypothetical protein